MANIYIATDQSTRDTLQRRYRRGELFRIRKGIYADSVDESAQQEALFRQWIEIANYLFRDAIAVYRTAVELKPTHGRIYLMTAACTRRTVPVGPLAFTVETGVVTDGVEPFSPQMKRSNLPRRLLENLIVSRAKGGVKKTLGQNWVEDQLVQVMQQRDKEGLNRIRDEAAGLAGELGLKQEMEQLNNMISALLLTRPSDGMLRTRSGIAHAAGKPFDTDRLQRFQMFADYLNRVDLVPVPYKYDSSGWRALAFFESFFSNYIEGTRFTIDDAEVIYASGEAAYERHADSHDLLSHIEITADHTEMCRVPESAVDLIDILKARHGILLAQRPEKRPGEFKEKPNQVGSTLFVAPELVPGTLKQGFNIYAQLPAGIKRGLFIHFLIAECHPFDDGNGRLSRIMLNAELVAADNYKIIVPNVARDNYLGGLRDASRHHRFRTIVKVLHQLHQYTAAIPWHIHDEARAVLVEHAALLEPDEGLMRFNKQLSKYTGDYKAG